MSESNKAVFLSYASQDAEAARKICEALRSGGVEVWFDADGGLEHGDEWDAKIRRQIKECVLFIPVISASTQAREEGYFRIEWDLAAERARGIASGVPFILPVVIDDTREPEALVPDRFRMVQWTKLRGGEVPAEVRARFLKLWSHRTGMLKNEAASASAASVHAAPSATESIGKPGAKNYALRAAAIALIVGGAGWWLLGGRNKSAASSPASASVAVVAPAKSTPAAAPQSEARQLVVKARALFEAVDSIRDDFLLAEDLLKQALAKDGADAEVWACYSQLHNRFVVRGWEVTNARKEGAQVAAQRALRLDPQSFEARFAQASLAGDMPTGLADGERAWRELRRERPTDQRVLVSLAIVVRKLNRQDEANALYDESAALPGGDPLALYDKSLDAWFIGRTAEAEAAMRAAIAQKPFSGALLMTAWYAMILHGDLDGALAALNRVPPATLREDRGCFFAYLLHYYRRETDAALARLAELPRDWLDDNWYRGPKGRLAGEVLQRAGRTEAAAAVWRAALKQVETRIATTTMTGPLLYNRIYLLASLGERDEAVRQFAVLLQMNGVNLADDKPVPVPVTRICVLLGRHAEAIQQIRRGLKVERHAVDYTAATLRLDGDWDPLRGEPEFAKVIAEAEAMEKAAALSSGGGSGAAMAPAPDAKSAAADKSVAVLAFADLSAARDSEYFSDGISEELLNVLAKVPGLKVTARTSAFFFKGKNLPIPEIAAKLGVAYVVEGSVQRAGERVKITAQLIKAADGFHVWSDTFTRDAKDVFAVEEEIAGLIAKQLSLKLGVSSAAATASVNPRAFELYVEARQAWNLRTAAGYDRAEVLLNRTLELEPNFARAHAALADVWSSRAQDNGTIGGLFGDRRSPEYRRIIAKIEEALALDPNAAEARASQGLTRGVNWEFSLGEDDLRQAIGLNPNYASAHQWLGRLLLHEGRMDEGLAELKIATEIDPLSPRILDNYGWGLALAGRHTEALAFFDRVLTLQPNSAQTLANKAADLARLGRLDEAVQILKNLPENSSFYARAVRSVVLGRADSRGEEEALLSSTDRRIAQFKPMLLLALGRKTEALQVLDEQTIISSLVLDWLFDPVIDPIRDDPRFVKFIATLGLTEAHARAQVWRKVHPPEKPAK